MKPPGLGDDLNHLGVRITITDNNSLKYIGGGFEKEPYNLITFDVKNNLSLNNLCVFKQKILEFPNPQSNIDFLYPVSNNAAGAESIEAIKSNKCGVNNSINEISNSFTAIISPNPAKDKVNFNISGKGKSQIFIHDMQGKLMEKRMIENRDMLDVTNYAEGIYLIDIIKDGERQARKLVIEH